MCQGIVTVNCLLESCVQEEICLPHRGSLIAAAKDRIANALVASRPQLDRMYQPPQSQNRLINRLSHNDFHSQHAMFILVNIAAFQTCIVKNLS
jgi:hypothetical protein